MNNEYHCYHTLLETIRDLKPLPITVLPSDDYNQSINFTKVSSGLQLCRLKEYNLDKIMQKLTTINEKQRQLLFCLATFSGEQNLFRKKTQELDETSKLPIRSCNFDE